jgi:hypothetical protein
MIICTERNDTVLLALLFDSMSVRADRHDLPDGLSLQIPNLEDCLGLYEELGFSETAKETKANHPGKIRAVPPGGVRNSRYGNPLATNPLYEGLPSAHVLNVSV